MRTDLMIVIVVMFLLCVVGLACCGASTNADLFNDGVCGKCEQGEWQFVNASHYKRATYYYYECPVCHNVIETTQPMY